MQVIFVHAPRALCAKVFLAVLVGLSGALGALADESDSPTTTTLQCINSENGYSIEAPAWDHRGLFAFDFSHRGFDEVFIGGRTGWHPTWIVAIDFSGQQPTAFETFGVAGENSAILFRKAVPQPIFRALEVCGLGVGSVWTGKPFFPSERPQPPLSLDHLLPP
jgi:hypothetical protein